MFSLTSWQACLACSGAATFNEELKIVPCTQALHHVRVQNGTVHIVTPALNWVNSPLDEECSQPSQQPTTRQRFLFS